jgi:hypothetical protein
VTEGLATTRDPSGPARTRLSVLADLLAGYGRRDFAVRLWDGTDGPAQLYQALLAKPDGGRTGLPPTRADWYAERGWTGSRR